MKFLSQITNKSEFNKNVFTLVTGQVIVQLIALLIYFIIPRLYLPEQIGIYSVFVTISTVLVIVSTGRYDAAMVVEETDGGVKSLWGLSLLMSFGFSCLLFIILYFFSNPLLDYFNVKGLDYWVFFIPLIVFVGAFIKVTQFYLNRYAEYKKMKNSDIVKSSTNSFFSIGFGVLKMLSGGLIMANIVGNIFSSLYLVFQLPISFWKELIPFLSLEKLKLVAKKYKNYLTLYSLSGLLNALVSNGTPLFIVYFFSEKIAGYYFMAEKMIAVPLALVVGSISKVFYQKANELYREDALQFLDLTKSIQKRMLVFLIPFLLVLSIAGPYLFKFLGNGWEQAGEMVKYFAIFTLFNNVVSPVGSISNIINRLDILLYFNISIVFFRLITFYIGSLYFTFEYSLLISSIAISVCYLTLDFVLKKIIKKSVLK